MTAGPNGCSAAQRLVTLAHPQLRAVHVIMPASPRAAQIARQATRRALASWSIPHLQDNADQVVTELVSNAVRYGSAGCADITLRLEVTGAWLRIEVHDTATALPQPRIPTAFDESGYGFVIVEALTAKWGIRETKNGKAVWAELANDQPALL